MAFSVIGVRRARRGDGSVSDRQLRSLRPVRDLFDRVPVPIPRPKVHPGINPGRVVAQHAIDRADSFEDGAPIQVREVAKAANRIREGHVIGRLLALLELDHVRGRRTQLVFEPRADRLKRERFSLQEADEVVDDIG